MDNLKIFKEVESKTAQLDQYWNNFCEEISQHLPASYISETAELSEKLKTAIEILTNELQNPTLTLATTGTTSSGKSTLVNLLCGAEIVPVAVSEMSAGIVTIEYSQEKSLVIHQTPGAEWECGEWHNISEEEIYQRLYQVMTNYIDSREKNQNLACPQSLLRYPFRLSEGLDLDLPKNTKVKIMDLPGLAHVGDEGNASIIRSCREALCIVTYNSAETDQMKVRNLLQEVVDQVKGLGGSPARMLFVLNKIDVFRTDKNWPETEERFAKKTKDSIKQELVQSLREHSEDIENLKVVKLSTLPALLSCQIREAKESLQEVFEDLPRNEENWSKSDRERVRKAKFGVEACRKSDQHFTALVAEEIIDDLPRKQERWSRQDQIRFAESLWRGSYAGEFEDNLKRHITEYFPQLVIPQMIERFNVSAGNAVAEWATQTSTAILHSSEESYQKECENIANIRESLNKFLEISNSKLREPFEKIDSKFRNIFETEGVEEDPVVYLEQTIAGLKKIEPYNSLGDKLYPLYSWRREIGQGVNQILEAVARSLETGKVDLDIAILEKANDIQVNLLERNLKRLVEIGYTGPLAEKGETREARTNEDKSKIKQLNDDLNELAIHLNIVMEEVLKRISTQELDRMYQAVSDLLGFHLLYLEQGANDLAPNMSIKFPESQLNKVEGKPEFSLNFQAGFAVVEGSWEEAVPESFRERVWWKAWLGKATKYKTVYKTRSSDNAEIPPIETLLTGWMNQAKDAELEIVNQIVQWLLLQIDRFKEDVNRVQNDVIDRYQSRLDKAREEVTLDYSKKVEIWQPIQRKAHELAEEFSKLSKMLQKEN